MTEQSPELNCPPIRSPVTSAMENWKFFDFWDVVEESLHFQHTTSYNSTTPSWKKSNQVSSVHGIPRLPFCKVNGDDGKIQGVANQSFIVLCTSYPADWALQHLKELIRMKAQTTGPLKPQIYFSYHPANSVCIEVNHLTQFALVPKLVLSSQNNLSV